jgi:uncharacterized protein
MKSLALKFLRAYKRLISPLLPAACKYVPTCSEYAVEAVERFGIVRGGWMTLWRVLRCNPFVKGGVDPVEWINSFHADHADDCGSRKANDGIRVV